MKVGFAIGHKIIKNQDYITDIVIWRRSRTGLFKFQSNRRFQYHDACPRFIFNKHSDQELLFFSKRYVFEIDYVDEEDSVRNVFYKIKNQFKSPPTLGNFSPDHDKVIIANKDTLLFINLSGK